MKDIKFNAMDFNYQQYHEFGERLTLPYGIKAMLEPGCHEYIQLPMEKRAIHLAYVLYHGFDLVEEIRERVRDYAPYSREYQYKNGMAATIMYLRTGKAWSFLFDEDRVKLEDVVQLLKDELMMRYTVNDYSHRHELKKMHMNESVLKGKSREEIQDFLMKPCQYDEHFSMVDLECSNPWPAVYNKWPCFRYSPWNICLAEDEQAVYEGDRRVIEDYNERHKKANDKQFILNIPPEPYRGNLRNPKLVILSLNPGYVERLNGNLVSMLDEKHRENFLSALYDNICLEEGSSVVFNEEDNVIGDGYWRRMMDDIKEDLKDEKYDFMKKIALIQYIPYFSKEMGSHFKMETLPTQYYAKHLIRRILYEEPDALFLVMRSEKQWKSLIGDEMEKFENRFIVNEHPLVQKLSRNNLNTKERDVYGEILKRLRK